MSKKSAKQSKNAFVRLMQFDVIPGVPDVVGVYIIAAAVFLVLIGYVAFTYILV